MEAVVAVGEEQVVVIFVSGSSCKSNGTLTAIVMVMVIIAVVVVVIEVAITIEYLTASIGSYRPF